MQLVEEMTIKSTRGLGRENTETFQRVKGAVFCKECGKEYNEREISGVFKCGICDGVEFVSGDFAEMLAGYMRLAKAGKLKGYYRNKFNRIKSPISMNSNRMIEWLLTKDGYVFVGDKKTEKFVRSVLWKKW